MVPEEGPAPDDSPLPAEPAPPALRLEFTPSRFTLALANVHLRYRLRLTNTGGEALGPITLAGDMTSLPATGAQAERFANRQTPLPELHGAASLAPGETMEMIGELRLPLGMAEGISLGDAKMLVPLVRLRLTADIGEQAPLISLHHFVVGGVEGAADGHLAPFRLDLGPHNRTDLIARPAENDTH